MISVGGFSESQSAGKTRRSLKFQLPKRPTPLKGGPLPPPCTPRCTLNPTLSDLKLQTGAVQVSKPAPPGPAVRPVIGAQANTRFGRPHLNAIEPILGKFR